MKLANLSFFFLVFSSLNLPSQAYYLNSTKVKARGESRVCAEPSPSDECFTEGGSGDGVINCANGGTILCLSGQKCKKRKILGLFDKDAICE